MYYFNNKEFKTLDSLYKWAKDNTDYVLYARTNFYKKHKITGNIRTSLINHEQLNRGNQGITIRDFASKEKNKDIQARIKKIVKRDKIMPKADNFIESDLEEVIKELWKK